MPWLRLSNASSFRERRPTRARRRWIFASEVPRISPSWLKASYTVVRPANEPVRHVADPLAKVVHRLPALAVKSAFYAPFLDG